VEQEFFDEIAADADALAERFRQFCMDMPAPGPDRMFSEVYAEESPLVAAQREAFLAYHASFEGA
jgi:pyruvate dehydrogenase E1 component alpha subunit